MATIKIKAAPEESTQQFVPYRTLPQLPYVRFPNPTSGLEKGLKQLAVSFEQMSKASTASFETGLETEFLKTIADVNTYALEEYRKSPADGVGYTERVGNYYTQKQVEFLQKIENSNIPDNQKKFLKQKYAQKFLRHQIQFEPKIYGQEVQLHDNKVKLDLEKMLRAAESELYTNPAALNDVQKRTLEAIDGLSLPEAERERLKLTAKKRLQSAALRFESAGTYIDIVLERIIKWEGTGKNENSSAFGIGQFTEGTWLSLIRKYYPKYYQTMSKKALLAMRKDPVFARRMGRLLLKEHIVGLKNHGYQPTPGLLRLAWVFGQTPELYRVLRAPDNTPLTAILSQKTLSQNPSFRKHTAGSIRRYYFNQMKDLKDPYPDVSPDLKTSLVVSEAERTLSAAQGSLNEQQILFKESVSEFVDSLVGLPPEEAKKKIDEAKKSGLFDYVSGSVLQKLEDKIVEQINDKILSNIRLAEALGKEYIIPPDMLQNLSKETQRAYAAFRKNRRAAILKEGKKLADEESPFFETWAENVKNNPYMQTALPEVERLRKKWQETQKNKEKAELKTWIYLGDPYGDIRIQEAFEKGIIDAKEREELLKKFNEKQNEVLGGFKKDAEDNILSYIERGLANKRFIDSLRFSKGFSREFREKAYKRWKEVEAEKKQKIRESWNTLKGDFRKAIARGEEDVATELAKTILKSPKAPADLVELAKKYIDDRFGSRIEAAKAVVASTEDPHDALSIIRSVLNKLDPKKNPKAFREFKKLEEETLKKIYKETEDTFIHDAIVGKISVEDVERAWEKKVPWLTRQGYEKALAKAKENEKTKIKAEEEKNLEQFQNILVEVANGVKSQKEAEEEASKLFGSLQYRHYKQIREAARIYEKKVEDEKEKNRLETLAREGGFIDPKSDEGKFIDEVYVSEKRNDVLAGDSQTAASIVSDLASRYQMLPKSAVSDIERFLLSGDVRSFAKGVEMLFQVEKASPYVVQQLNDQARAVWSYVSVMRQYGVDYTDMFNRLQAVRETLADPKKRKALEESIEQELSAKGNLTEHIIDLLDAGDYVPNVAKEISGPLLVTHYRNLYKVFRPLFESDKDADEAVARVMRRMWGSWDSKHNDESWFGNKTRFMLLPPNIVYLKAGTGDLGTDYSWVDDWLDNLAEKYGYDRIILVADKQSIDEFSKGVSVTYQAYGVKKDQFVPVLLPERVKPDLSFREKQLQDAEDTVRFNKELEDAFSGLSTPYGVYGYQSLSQFLEETKKKKARRKSKKK